MRVAWRSFAVLAGLGLFLSTGFDVIAQSGGRQVVIRAITGEGVPVLDLKPEELTLRVDGRARQVGRLDLVRPGTAAASPAAPAAPPSLLPPPFTTNVAEAAPKGAREFLVAVDNEGIASGRDVLVRDTISKLIGMLSPQDRIGLIAMSQGGLNVAPTTQHSAVLAALPRLVTTGSASESAVDLACRTKVMLGTLGGFLQNAPPERSVVFVSSAMAPISVDGMKRAGTGESSRADAVACEIRTDDMEGLGRIALASPAQVFVVWYSDGLANGANRSTGQAGLENVAGVTGADYVPLAGTPDVPATRINRAAGTYYVATLDDSPGEARRVDVRVSRDGIRASARPWSGDAATASGKVTPREMIRTASVYRELPLRAAAFLSRQANGSDLAVRVLFEPEEAGTKLTAATIIFYDQKGSGKAQWNAQSSDLQTSPAMAVSAVPPGTYRMRVAATDAKGRAGTTDVTLRAELPDAGPVKLGSMILGIDPKSPKLQFAATDKQVIGFLQIYGVAKDAEVTVTYEIRESETSPAIGTMNGNPLPVPNGPADERMFWGGFGLDPLAPGDYLMRAVVSVNGKEVGAASRTRRKVR